MRADITLTKGEKFFIMENRDKQLPSKYSTEKHEPFHERLRYERHRHGWSQADVAAKIDSDTKSVGRWERGEAFPSPYHRYRLLELFGKNAQEMGLVEAGTDSTSKVSPKSLPSTIADVTRQINEQLEQLEEESQIRVQGISQAGQNIDKKQGIELEKQWLELLEKRLEVQKKEVEYALEMAKKVVDTLRPNADVATRAKLIQTLLPQTLLPNFLQLLSEKGLELTLTALEDEE